MRAFQRRRRGAPEADHGVLIPPAVVQPVVFADDDLPAAWREHQEVAALAPFAYQGHQVRVTTDEHGVTWFVAADVCDALDLGNTWMALDRLDDDEKGVSSIPTPGGQQSMTTVNEPGLYSLILGSRKPEAKAFKRWVTHEVLPAIRRTGSYGVPAAPTLTPGIHVVARSQRQASWLWAEAVERHVGAALMLDIAHGPRTQAQPTFQLHLLPTT
ncbi:MAG: hypothetical protein EBZ51_13305 [Synechococcaceae bacterium WB9_2_112]|nr:hypothetical protein [Synechococcaceae bacterium WB9_2_112]